MANTMRITGKHVLLTLIGFFGVIIVVNAIFLTYAIRSFPGESEKKSYMQGLNYNDVLNERAEQASLGWRAAVSRVENSNSQGAVELTIVDNTGAPLPALTVKGALKRPTHNDADISLAFTHIENGLYRAQTPVLEGGGWDMEANATDNNGKRFDIASRIIVE